MSAFGDWASSLTNRKGCALDVGHARGADSARGSRGASPESIVLLLRCYIALTLDRLQGIWRRRVVQSAIIAAVRVDTADIRHRVVRLALRDAVSRRPRHYELRLGIRTGCVKQVAGDRAGDRRRRFPRNDRSIPVFSATATKSENLRS